MLLTLFHLRIKLRFSLEVTMDSDLLQLLQNMKMMHGLIMEISKDAEAVLDQLHLVLQQ